MLRRQLPVSSPLPGGAIVTGAHAALSGGSDAREEVRDWLHSRYRPEAALLVDSGTSALALAIAACGPGTPRLGSSRDYRADAPPRVALPAWGCYDLATAADMAGATVRLYDLDPETLGPDSDSLARVLEQGVDCVVIVHAFGLAVDHDMIRELVADHRVTVIEDAAQAAGGSWNERTLGSLGTLSVLSFGRGKGITAGGGGALLAHGERGALLLARVAPLVQKGGRGVSGWVKTTAQWALARPAIYAVPSALPFLHLGATIYQPPHVVRQLSGAAAGVLLRTMGTIDREARTRRRNARAIDSAVTSGRFTPIPPLPGSEPGYLRLPLLAPTSARHEIDASVARLGVMPGYPMPLNRLDGFDRVVSPGEYPGAELLAERLLTVPVHGQMSVRDLDRLSRWLSDGRAGVRSAGTSD